MNKLSLNEICDKLVSSGRTLILGHVNPDGDCIGSACALAEMISLCGGSADVAWDGDVPERLRFICDSALTFENTSADRYDTVMAVDVASPGQLGRFSEIIPKINFMIDHHGTGEPFADNLIDAGAAAAGEIVYSVYRELLSRGAIRPSPRAMRLIYVAIVSDTGSFKFSNTTPHTLYAAAELTAGINYAGDGGLDTSDLCRLLFGRFTLREMKAKMLAIQNMQLYEDGNLGIVLFTRDILDKNGLDDADISGAIDTPRCIDGVYVALCIKQVGETMYRVSSRANVDIDCSAVCASFGGGGHTRAAGCSIEAKSPEEAVKKAISSFGAAVREYKKNKPETKARI